MLGERLLHGARQPDLQLDLIASAEPLMRLNVDEEQEEEWLSRHEAYVRANSGQPPPPPPPSPPTSPAFPQLAGLSRISSIGNMFAGDMYAKPEDAEEFERRVSEYLSELRAGLLEHLVRMVVKSDENKVYFAVANETDDTVTGVQLTVVVPRDGLLVYTRPPASTLPCRMPRWPDPIYDRMANVEPVRMPEHYDFGPSGAVVETDESFEITWDISNLRPAERSDPRCITIVAGTGTPDEVEVELVARAMDRRRNVRSKATLTMASGQWTLDDWLNPEPGC
jgi:hypothetical protein